jgi:hypothetical protein
MTETDRCTAWWESFTCTEPAEHEGPHREYVRGEGGVGRFLIATWDDMSKGAKPHEPAAPPATGSAAMVRDVLAKLEQTRKEADAAKALLARAAELGREYLSTTRTLTALRAENAPRSDYARRQCELEVDFVALLAEIEAEQ